MFGFLGGQLAISLRSLRSTIRKQVFATRGFKVRPNEIDGRRCDNLLDETGDLRCPSLRPSHLHSSGKYSKMARPAFLIAGMGQRNFPNVLDLEIRLRASRPPSRDAASRRTLISAECFLLQQSCATFGTEQGCAMRARRKKMTNSTNTQWTETIDE